MKRFEEIDHTADWAFRAFGRDLPELFENAAAAVFEMEGVTAGSPAIERSVEVEGIDLEALLVNWLGELLYLQETHREGYHRFSVRELTPTRLQGTVAGSPLGNLNRLVKAITYHNLKIEQTPEGWQATVVVDV